MLRSGNGFALTQHSALSTRHALLIELDVLDLVNHAGGISGDDHPRRNVFGDDRSRADQRPRADTHPRQQHHVRADDRALFDLPAPATEPAFLDGKEPVEPPVLIRKP